MPLDNKRFTKNKSISFFKKLAAYEWFFLLFSIAGAGLFSLLLFQENLFQIKGDRSSLDEVGEVRERKADVRRKSNLEYLWSNLNPADPLYQGDTVFTGPGSSALIQLKNGNQLSLAENSLVVLNETKEGVLLDLKFGDVNSKLADHTQLKVKIGNKTLALKGKDSEIRLQSQLDKESAVRVVKGKVKVSLDGIQESPQGNSLSHAKPAELTLGAQEKVAISEGGEAAVKKDFSFESLSPEGVDYLRADQSLNFEWATMGEANGFLLELASDQSFQKILHQSFTINNKTRMQKLPKSRQKLFWRVKAMTEKKEVLALSNVIPLEIRSVANPEFVEPALGETFEFKRDLTTDELVETPVVVAELKRNDYDLPFQLQLIKKTDFDKKNFSAALADEMIIGERHSFFIAESGSYVLRARVFYQGQALTPWSKGIDFRVLIEKKDDVLAAPRLTKRFLLFDSNKHQVPPQISWSKVPGAKEYALRIAESEDFSTSLLELNTAGNTFDFNHLKSGDYYFRVQGITKKDRPGAWSQIGKVSVRMREPEIKSVEDLVLVAKKKGDPPLSADSKIQWSKVPGAAEYQTELSENSDFTSPITQNHQTENSSIRIPSPGDWYVRVIAMDERFLQLTEPSKAKKVNYTFLFPLEAPLLTEPESRISYFLKINQAPYIPFSWTMVEGAVGYELEWSQSSDFQPVIKKVKTTDNSWVLTDKKLTGTLWFRVRALSLKKHLHSPFSEKRMISIVTSLGQFEGE